MKVNPKFQKILNIINNKWIIALIVFVVLLLFESKHNIFRYHSLYKQRKELQAEKKYLQEQITRDSTNTANIQKNLDAAEKLGREKYLMKRDNEDIFIIRHAEDTTIKQNFN